MENLEKQLLRIYEIMGVKNLPLIHEITGSKNNKTLLNEQLGFIRKLFGANFGDLPQGWRRVVNPQGVIRRIEIPGSAGNPAKVIEDDPSFFQEINDALVNGTKRYDELSVGAKNLLWKIYREAPLNQATGTIGNKTDMLYNDLIDDIIAGTDNTEMDVLAAISDDMTAVVQGGAKKSLKDVLMDRFQDELVVKAVISKFEKRMKYFKANQLKRVEGQVIGDLKWPESVKAFKRRQRLDNTNSSRINGKTQLERFYDKVQNPGKMELAIKDVNEARDEIETILKEIQAGTPVTKEMEKFILARMRKIYVSDKIMSAEMDAFIKGLKESGESDFEFIADTLEFLKTQNGGRWDALKLYPWEKNFLGSTTLYRFYKSTMEGLKAGFRINVFPWGKVFKKGTGTSWLNKIPLQNPKKVFEEEWQSVGPNWTKALWGGSDRGLPWRSGDVIEDSRVILDNYKPLRDLAPGARVNVWPYWSYVVELGARAVKWGVLNTLTTMIKTIIDKFGTKLNEKEAECFNEILKYLRENEIPSKNIIDYIIGDENAKPNLRKELIKKVPCVELELPLDGSAKILDWMQLLDIYLSGESDTYYGDGKPVPLSQEWLEQIGETIWNSKEGGPVVQTIFLFSSFDEYIDLFRGFAKLAEGSQEVRELTEIEKQKLRVALLSGEPMFRDFCAQKQIRYMGYAVQADGTPIGCAGGFQYKFELPSGWEPTQSTCDENWGKQKIQNIKVQPPSTDTTTTTPAPTTQTDTTKVVTSPQAPKTLTPAEEEAELEKIRQKRKTLPRFEQKP